MSTTVRNLLVVLAVSVFLAAGAFATARAVGRDDEAGTPAHTVRDFLTTAVVERAGVYACRYLTPRAIREAEAAQPSHVICPAAIWSTRLVLGGKAVSTEAAVQALDYRVRERGDRAQVSVSGNGATVTFGLRRATGNERVGFALPHTAWRIDSGVGALMPSRSR